MEGRDLITMNKGYIAQKKQKETIGNLDRYHRIREAGVMYLCFILNCRPFSQQPYQYEPMIQVKFHVL